MNFASKRSRAALAPDLLRPRLSGKQSDGKPVRLRKKSCYKLLVIKVVSFFFVGATLFTTGCKRSEQDAGEFDSVLHCRAFFLYERLTLFSRYHDDLDSASSLSDLETTKSELLMQMAAIIRTFEEDKGLREAINSMTPFLNEKIEAAKSSLLEAEMEDLKEIREGQSIKRKI